LGLDLLKDQRGTGQNGHLAGDLTGHKVLWDPAGDRKQRISVGHSDRRLFAPSYLPSAEAAITLITANTGRLLGFS
jgi:hypothetical protein